MDKVIIVSGGLCNTIKCMININILKDIYNIKDNIIYINFIKDNYVNIDAQDLKRINRLPGDILNVFYNLEKKTKYKDSMRTWRIITFKKDNLKHNIFYINKDKYSNKYGDIDLLYDKIPIHIQQKIILNLKKIEINKDILDYVDIFQAKFDDNTISIQCNPSRYYTFIKKTNKWNISDFEKHMYSKNSYLYKFINRMKSFKNSNFYLSLSYMPFLDIFIKEFGRDRIICTPFDQKRTWKEDIIDLLLLSKNNHIVGTYLSTFCEVAWYYSECKSTIEIII